MNIFVSKLSFNTTEDELREVFEEYGEVESCKVIMDQFTGKSRGFGFVEMPSDDEAREAINNLNETELDGRQIIVKKAEPKESRGGGGRGGFGGGGGGDRRGGGGGGYGGGGGGDRRGGGGGGYGGGGGGGDRRGGGGGGYGGGGGGDRRGGGGGGGNRW